MKLSRLCALVVAGVVAGAPVSATACEILCATRASLDASGDSRQSCHAGQPTGASEIVSSQGHVCAHGDERPVSFGVTGDRSLPHPDVALVIAQPIRSVTAVPLEGSAAKLPPDPRRSRVPLRI